MDMRNRYITAGRPRQIITPEILWAALAEFIATFIFVFAGSGSGIAMNKITGNTAATPDGLIASAIAHAFALSTTVKAAAKFSDGHVNPAVTFGAFITGNINIFHGIVYWIAQLLGSIVSCLLLKFATGGQSVQVFGLSEGVGVKSAVVLEMVMTFGLVYTVHAISVDPKKRECGLDKLAPIAIGLIFGANILVGGAFDGACMNPALSFGPAVVGWSWDNHWVYWVGPLLGGGLAGFVYEFFFITD